MHSYDLMSVISIIKLLKKYYKIKYLIGKKTIGRVLEYTAVLNVNNY